MLRDTADPASKFVDVMVTPGQGVIMQWRGAAGGQSNLSQINGVAAPAASNPIWLMLIRSGTTYTGWYTANGSPWTQIGSATVAFSNGANLAGLAVTSRNYAALCAATFNYVTENVSPPAPANLTGTGSGTQVALAWTPSAGATSYNVYRGTTSGGESSTPIATGVASASYTDTGLSNTTTYFYEVTAVDSAGSSRYSNETSAKP